MVGISRGDISPAAKVSRRVTNDFTAKPEAGEQCVSCFRPSVGPNVFWSCQRSPRMTCPV